MTFPIVEQKVSLLSGDYSLKRVENGIYELQISGEIVLKCTILQGELKIIENKNNSLSTYEVRELYTLIKIMNQDDVISLLITLSYP